MNLTSNEIDNLAKLLASPLEENLALGMELLRQEPKATPQLLAPLMLIRHFMNMPKLKQLEQWQAEIGVLLNTYLPTKLIKKYDDHFLVFQWIHLINNKRWSEFRAQLVLFEEQFNFYEPYILHHPIYLKQYHQLSTYLLRQYKKPSYAFPYIKKVMETQTEDSNLKTTYVDLMLNYLFPKNLYLEEVPKVIEELNKLIQLTPSEAHQYYHVMGIVYGMYIKDHETAKKYYYKCISILPTDGGALNNLANILFKYDANYEEARALAQRAVEVKENIHHYDTLATIEFLGFQNLEKAKILLERAFEITQKHHFSITLYGEILAAQGHFTEAQIWYERGLKLNPSSEYKLTILVELLFFKLNNWSDALHIVRKLLKYHPNNWYAKYLETRIIKKQQQ